MISVPDLTFNSAIQFIEELSYIILEEGEEFNFSGVYTCDPFPMLLVSTAIRQLRQNSNVKKCKAINCNNTYAEHMRFFKAIGINKGRELSENYGNSNYLPITKLEIRDLKNEGIANIERIQEVIENKAKSMSRVLSNGNVSFMNWLKYILTEIMRNIPEHSQADAIWYCAQYWPRYDLVELAILDEGIGIRESLIDNPAHSDEIKNDEDALRLAIQPGISKAFAPGCKKTSDDIWANSGYGLFMVSRLCEELGGSFIIVSGERALKVANGSGCELYSTEFNGTAIQIRMRPSKINDYEEIAKRILCEGEKIAKQNSGRFESASKSSKSLFWNGE
jgi:hypothetical protein